MEDKKTTAERTAAGRSTGKFRCMNCMARITAPTGAKQAKCPQCGYEWRLSWLGPTFIRCRGPVWDVNRRLIEEEMKKK